MTRFTNRRTFLKTTLFTSVAAATGGQFVTPGLASEKSPSSRLNIACIGVNGKGASNLSNVKSEHIVALCDTNDANLELKGKDFPEAKRFVDFREMFDQVKDIDAAVISTPDHTHAVATVAALKRKIHCYTEKPLAHEIGEIRIIQRLARENKLCTQMGTVIHATENYRRVVELIQSGSIGQVKEVHVWCFKGWGGFSMPKTKVPCPPNIHWDLWLGPAEHIDYDPCYLPARWRGYWPFGTGTFGDMACHLMDLPFWALDLGYPLSVEATCPVEVDPMLCPLDVKARYEFKVKDKNGSNRILPLTWYDGKERPPIIAEKGLADLGMGIIFEGTDGILEADYSTIKLYPEEKFAKFQRPKPWIPASPGHYLEWLNAIKNGGPQALCEFEYAGRLSEAVQLGAVSLRAGKKKLIWDAAAAKITNDQQANAFIMRKYRDGWTL